MKAMALGLARLRPPELSAVVARRRLERQLAGAVARVAVTLVCAGAGGGKTTAVAAWERGRRPAAPVAWVTADETHNEPAVLRRDVYAALSGDAEAPVAESLTEAAFAAVPGNAPAILVVDDLEKLVEPRVLDEFRHLLDHRPRALRLVLISRSDPPLRLQRFRVAGDLADVRARDLAFDRREAAQLFGQYGIDLSGEQMDVVLERTQGWPAGLRLAAMSLDPAAVDEGIAGFAGDQRAVAEYLTGEVLAHLPERVHRLLRRTSAVEEFTGPLAVELSGDEGAASLLHRLADDNELFFRTGPDRQTFRCHPLLRELLYRQVVAERPDRVHAQHRAAALWMAANGEATQAVRHATLAHDDEVLGHVLAVSGVPAMFGREAPAIMPALRTAEPAPPATGPVGGLRAAMRHLLASDAVGARNEVATARDGAPGPPGVDAALDLLDAVACAAMADCEATIATAERAGQSLAGVPADGRASAAPYRAIVAGLLGAALWWADRPVQAEAYLCDAAREARRHGLSVVEAGALGHLALLGADRGELRAAERHARAALRLAPGVAAARLALARVHLLRADFHGAREQLRRVADGAGGLPRLAAVATEADIYLAGGASARATALLDELRAEAHREHARSAVLDRWSARTAAGIAARSGDPGPTVDLSDERMESLLAEPYRLAGVEAWTAYAVRLNERHDEAGALRAMRRALDLAEPEELRLPLLAPGAADLLRRARPTASGVRAFVDSLPVPAARPLDAHPPELVEALTERELVILRCLPTMKCNAEIGEGLFVTVNTVKAHLKSVYRKLGVGSRRAAVSRARELHLL